MHLSRACISQGHASLQGRYLSGYTSLKAYISHGMHLSRRASLRACISQGMHLMGVHLKGVYLMGVHQRYASYRYVAHRDASIIGTHYRDVQISISNGRTCEFIAGK
jgi:hypothetical protein